MINNLWYLQVTTDTCSDLYIKRKQSLILPRRAFNVFVDLIGSGAIFDNMFYYSTGAFLRHHVITRMACKDDFSQKVLMYLFKYYLLYSKKMKVIQCFQKLLQIAI